MRVVGLLAGLVFVLTGLTGSVSAAGTGTVLARLGPLTVSAGALPPGLSLNASGGEITGTPTVAGGNTFTINVASSNSQNANEMIGLSVAAPSPQSGTVTVTATSGGIVNSVTIPVTLL